LEAKNHTGGPKNPGSSQIRKISENYRNSPVEIDTNGQRKRCRKSTYWVLQEPLVVMTDQAIKGGRGPIGEGAQLELKTSTCPRRPGGEGPEGHRTQPAHGN
jgi:hypothetical protein